MKFLTKPYVPPKERKEKEILTPEQKLDLLIQDQFKKDKRFKLREHHYKLIECGQYAILFNGLKKRIGEYSNDVHGTREARITAISIFTNSKNTNGGYLFD